MERTCNQSHISTPAFASAHRVTYLTLLIRSMSFQTSYSIIRKRQDRELTLYEPIFALREVDKAYRYPGQPKEEQQEIIDSYGNPKKLPKEELPVVINNPSSLPSPPSYSPDLHRSPSLSWSGRIPSTAHIIFLQI